MKTYYIVSIGIAIGVFVGTPLVVTGMYYLCDSMPFTEAAREREKNYPEELRRELEAARLMAEAEKRQRDAAREAEKKQEAATTARKERFEAEMAKVKERRQHLEQQRKLQEERLRAEEREAAARRQEMIKNWQELLAQHAARRAEIEEELKNPELAAKRRAEKVAAFEAKREAERRETARRKAEEEERRKREEKEAEERRKREQKEAEERRRKQRAEVAEILAELSNETTDKVNTETEQVRERTKRDVSVTVTVAPVIPGNFWWNYGAEYTLYDDEDNTIRSKSSQSPTVTFNNVKVKKGTKLRVNVVVRNGFGAGTIIEGANTEIVANDGVTITLKYYAGLAR